MSKVDEISQLVKEIGLSKIKNLSKTELLSLMIPRRGYPKQYGFILNPSVFDSHQQMGDYLYALLTRLHEVIEFTDR